MSQRSNYVHMLYYKARSKSTKMYDNTLHTTSIISERVSVNCPGFIIDRRYMTPIITSLSVPGQHLSNHTKWVQWRHLFIYNMIYVAITTSSTRDTDYSHLRLWRIFWSAKIIHDCNFRNFCSIGCGIRVHISKLVTRRGATHKQYRPPVVGHNHGWQDRSPLLQKVE